MCGSIPVLLSVGNLLDESTNELDGLEFISEISILEIVGYSVVGVSLALLLVTSLWPVESATSVDCRSK